MYVTSEWGAADIELLLDETKISTLDMANFRDEQEWHLFRHVEVEKLPEDPSNSVTLGYTAGFVVARCRVVRRIKYDETSMRRYFNSSFLLSYHTDIAFTNLLHRSFQLFLKLFLFDQLFRGKLAF